MSRRWSARISDGNSSTTPLGAEGAQEIVFRSITTKSVGAVLSIVITKPAGTAQDDVLVAFIQHDNHQAVITPPSGWTTVRQDIHDSGGEPGDSVNMTAYTLRAGAAEPADYTWTFDVAPTAGAVGTIAAYDHVVAAGNPVNAHNGAAEESALLDDTVTAPNVSGTTAGSMLVAFFVATDALGSFTPPAGMNERTDTQGVSDTFSVADQIFGAGGDTGQRTATFSTVFTEAHGAQMLALTPAAAGGGDTFFGVAEEVLDYSAVRIFCETDQFGFVDIDYSSDGINFRRTDSFSLVATERLVSGLSNRFRSELVPIRGRFVRVNVRNKGAVDQTYLRLQTILAPEADQPESRSPERNIMRTGIADVSLNVFTDVTAFSQETFDKAVEILGYGATFNHGATIGASFAYSMRLILGGATVHQTIVRDQRGNWVPLKLETEGKTFSVRVLHNEALDQSFRGFVQVREL